MFYVAIGETLLKFRTNGNFLITYPHSLFLTEISISYCLNDVEIFRADRLSRINMKPDFPPRINISIAFILNTVAIFIEYELTLRSTNPPSLSAMGISAKAAFLVGARFGFFSWSREAAVAIGARTSGFTLGRESAAAPGRAKRRLLFGGAYRRFRMGARVGGAAWAREAVIAPWRANRQFCSGARSGGCTWLRTAEVLRRRANRLFPTDARNGSL